MKHSSRIDRLITQMAHPALDSFQAKRRSQSEFIIDKSLRTNKTVPKRVASSKRMSFG
jgi:hypothetical protein